MADKMKHVYVPFVRQVALDEVSLLVIKSVPIKFLFVGVEYSRILCKASKWPVIYDKWMGKSMVVFNRPFFTLKI